MLENFKCYRKKIEGLIQGTNFSRMFIKSLTKKVTFEHGLEGGKKSKPSHMFWREICSWQKEHHKQRV